MTSPLPPRLRDTRALADLVRQNRQNAKQLGVGFVGGRFSPAKPLGATEQYGDLEDDTADDVEQMAGWNTDYAVCTTAGRITLPLTYAPIDGTLHIRWDGDDLRPAEYVLAGQSVIFTDPHIHVDDVLDAEYFYWPNDVPPEPEPLDSLTLRGVTGPADHPATLALPDGTQIGDLIVVGFATMHYTGAEGTATVTDARLTRVGHGAWVGRATTLADVAFSNPDDDLYTATVATYASPATYKNDADVGPTGTGDVTVSAPTAASSAAVLVVTVENFNSLDSTVASVPAGYVLDANPNQAALVCKAGIYHWVDGAADTSPAGNIAYTAVHGHAYATVIGLQGDEG